MRSGFLRDLENIKELRFQNVLASEPVLKHHSNFSCCNLVGLVDKVSERAGRHNWSFWKKARQTLSIYATRPHCNDDVTWPTTGGREDSCRGRGPRRAAREQLSICRQERQSKQGSGARVLWTKNWRLQQQPSSSKRRILRVSIRRVHVSLCRVCSIYVLASLYTACSTQRLIHGHFLHK